MSQGEDALPLARLDKIPLALIPAIALAALPLIPSLPTWVTLTVAGLAMGMMIFIMASGLTLVFGLMDVMNFAHGAFITIGAFVATSVLIPLAGPRRTAWMTRRDASCDPPPWRWPGARPRLRARDHHARYGQHLKQILITMGGLIVAEQSIHVIWGPDIIALSKPATLRGSFVFGDIAIEKYRVLAVIVGLAVFAAMFLVLNRTRVGLLIRAGVEDSEMVESLGYRIRRVFVGVFAAGSALAGLGGVMWALYQETVNSAMGMQVMILIFIVIIIGGLGSVGGCFIGALLVGLVANYVGFLSPKIALGSNILLMVLILLWRPQGLYPVAKR